MRLDGRGSDRDLPADHPGVRRPVKPACLNSGTLNNGTSARAGFPIDATTGPEVGGFNEDNLTPSGVSGRWTITQNGAVVNGAYHNGTIEVADEPTVMAATRDVGAVAALSLTSPPPASEVVDLEAPRYTERYVAEALGALLGSALRVVTISRTAGSTR